MQHYDPTYAERVISALRNPTYAIGQPRTSERPPLMCRYHSLVAAAIVDEDYGPLCATCGYDLELARAERRRQ